MDFRFSIIGTVLVLLLFPSTCESAPKKPKPAPEKGREVQRLDGAWRMFAQPDDSVNASDWASRPPAATVAVTGWSTSGATTWYWREVTLPDRWAKMNVRLHLGGLRVEDVWVNGKRFLQPETGSEPSTFDITRGLKAHQKNLLAVRGAAMARVAGAHLWDPSFNGAELIAADEAHIAHLAVDAKSNGWMTVGVEIVNASDKNGNADLTVEIVDRDHPKRLLATSTQHVAVSPGLNRSDITFRLKGAVVWKPDRPAIYTALVRFTQERDLLDNAAISFVFTEELEQHR